MADGMQIDVSEIRELIADFSQVPAQLARHARPVVSKGALNIKNQLRDEAKASRTLGFDRFIDYDLVDDGFGAEIGPRKEARGSLANIAYFGGVYGGGGTVPDPRGALEAEAPRFMQELAKLGEDLLS